MGKPLIKSHGSDPWGCLRIPWHLLPNPMHLAVPTQSLDRQQGGVSSRDLGSWTLKTFREILEDLLLWLGPNSTAQASTWAA